MPKVVKMTNYTTFGVHFPLYAITTFLNIVLSFFIHLYYCYYHYHYHCHYYNTYCRRVCSMGRPKKYTTKAEATAAHAAAQRQHRQRKRQLENQPRFVAY